MVIVAKTAPTGVLVAALAWCDAPAQGSFYAFSKGVLPCGDFLQAMDGERAARIQNPPPRDLPGYTSSFTEDYRSFVYFADGFLTGANYVSEVSVGAHTAPWSRALWLENYCRGHPLADFTAAVIELKDFLAAEK